MSEPGLPERCHFEFGPYRLNAGERLLTRGDEPVHLPPKTFDLLLVLVSHAGHLVSKAELRRLVWPDTFVDDLNLPQHISVLRRALRDGENGHRFIDTVPRLGYRFVAPVKVVDKPAQRGSAGTIQELANTDRREGVKTRAMRRLSFFGGASLRRGAVAAVVCVALGVGMWLSAKSHEELRRKHQLAEQNDLEGRYFWLKRTADGYRAAIAHFEEAARLNPDDAEAYAGLANSYVLLGSFGVEQPAEVIPKGRAAALRAVEINERCPEAHAALGYIFSRFEWNWGEADREFRLAIAIKPEYTTAHHWYALHLVTMGRTSEAIAQMRIAQRLEPSSAILSTDMALVLFYARHYDEAIQEVRKVIQADPAFGLAHRTLGIIYGAKGMYGEAIAELSVAAKLLDNDPWTLAEMGRCYALSGDRERAFAKIDELEELSRRTFVSPAARALLASSLPEKRDESFQWLEKEYDAHSSNVPLLAVYPGFDSIRSDRRFQEILDRAGLPSSNR